MSADSEALRLMRGKLDEARARLARGGFDPYHPHQTLDWQQDGLERAAALTGLPIETVRDVLRAVAFVRIEDSTFLSPARLGRSLPAILEFAHELRDEMASLSPEAIDSYDQTVGMTGLSMTNMATLLTEMLDGLTDQTGQPGND